MSRELIDGGLRLLAFRTRVCILRSVFVIAIASSVACGSDTTDDAGQSDAAMDGALPDDAGADAMSSTDAGTSTCDDGGLSLIAINLGRNDECLNVPLTGCGCRILLEGIDAGCGSSGLSPAPSADVSAIDAKLAAQDAGAGAGSICVLGELAAASPTGGGCFDETTVGWCYDQGPCESDAGLHCKQALCASRAFFAATGYVSAADHPGYTRSWLSCR